MPILTDQKIFKKVKRLKNVSIGADIEFIVTDENGCLQEAGEILGSNMESAIACDGDNTIGELRPHPAGSSMEIITTISNLMKQLPKEYLYFAGHFKHGLPIGGHIHIAEFEMPEEIDMHTVALLLNQAYITMSDAIDDLEERALRFNGGYGLAGNGNIRSKTDKWFEYRVPCSWLLCPEVAFMNLWFVENVAKCIMTKRYEMLKYINDGRGIIKFAEHTNDDDKKMFVKIADRVLSQLPLDWNVNCLHNWL
jgi:hypothetical protein